MFYVYYGYKGRDLDDKVNSFSRLRKKDGEIGQLAPSFFIA